MRDAIRNVPSWAWWSLAGIAFVTILFLTVLWFPVVLRPGLTVDQRNELMRQGTDKLVGAQDDRSNAQNNIRTTLLQGIAGAALLTGGYFAYKQLSATREGQITTRYTEAVRLIGDPTQVDARIGGIYALQRIGKDSTRDAPAVVELLSAFVRRSVPKRTSPTRPVESTSLSSLAPDVAIALRVLATLNGALLSGADFRCAILTEADLTNADLTEADLRGADLRGASCTRAALLRADLTGAGLEEADLSFARLFRADLSEAHLEHADLTAATLTQAHLVGAHLTRALLQAADLNDADFTGADFDLKNLVFTRGTPAFLPDGSVPVERRDSDDAEAGGQ